jgi:hypothetical protein
MRTKCLAPQSVLTIAGALAPNVIAHLPRQVLEAAKRAGVTRGRRFRIDTTVVETNVHYPTDSTLLQDGVRVLTRMMQPGQCGDGGPAGSGSQSAAQRDPPRPDHRIPSAVAEDARRLDRQLPKTDRHYPRRPARRGHDSPSHLNAGARQSPWAGRSSTVPASN